MAQLSKETMDTLESLFNEFTTLEKIVQNFDRYVIWYGHGWSDKTGPVDCPENHKFKVAADTLEDILTSIQTKMGEAVVIDMFHQKEEKEDDNEQRNGSV